MAGFRAINDLGRRSFLTGVAAMLAGPAIVRFSILMPLRGVVMDVPPPTWPSGNFRYAPGDDILVIPSFMYADLIRAKGPIEGITPDNMTFFLGTWRIIESEPIPA